MKVIAADDPVCLLVSQVGGLENVLEGRAEATGLIFVPCILKRATLCASTLFCIQHCNTVICTVVRACPCIFKFS